MMIAEQIIGILTAERNRQGLSQRDVAARMDCHVSFVQKIEHAVGDRQVSGYQRYADALGIKLRVEVVRPD
jgi:ribosome-binding protein aMBF1 (putative translation factor)